MIALLLSIALAGSLQQIHELEWRRAPATEIAAAAEDSDPSVRSAAATALGRLHRADALEPLVLMRGDRDSSVQEAVADALGWTEGSAPALRAWLDELPAPRGPAGRAAAQDGVRARAIEALGRQGDAGDLKRLTALLAEPWPTSASAAEALARMGRRRVEGTGEALPALVDALDRPDPRTVEAAAHAIRRVGLEGASSDVVARLGRASRSADRAQARAWLVAATASSVPPGERPGFLIDALTDASPLVRVAALDALGPEDLPTEAVEPWLRDPDPWVRQATLAALGRLGATEALERAAGESEDPWEVAWAIQSAEQSLGRDWRDEALPVVVRAAALGVSELGDTEWLAAATAEGPPALRTAACAVLLERETPPVGAVEALLGSPDRVVREAGIELLSKLEPKPRAEALLVHLRAEKEHELLANALLQLDALLEQDPTAVRADDRFLASALRRVASTETARVRLAARQVADRLGIPLPETAVDEIRELVLPSGTVVEVSRGAPVLEDVLRIRGARVRTSRGLFTISLDPETAPLAVANFAALARAGFYDGVPFHRVVPGFVAQTGCPRGDGWGGPGWSLPDEVSSKTFAEGSVGMARSAAWDTGGSQWFVSTADTPHLEGDYTRFGAVVQGMHVVRAMRRGDVVEGVEIEVIGAP